MKYKFLYGNSQCRYFCFCSLTERRMKQSGIVIFYQRVLVLEIEPIISEVDKPLSRTNQRFLEFLKGLSSERPKNAQKEKSKKIKNSKSWNSIPDEEINAP
ncbi:hypothetical protein BpHYR1_052848 [Brachionus plicatilis]|uniref:Uncharacterized protein n=1 Tax=Brachionus plicatilis TaxID=10195 RepID=A0A3M7RJ50_BRAPC|nr:hypothetical protein BpHYR1_052848 [Brachionus plicatilis]